MPQIGKTNPVLSFYTPLQIWKLKVMRDQNEPGKRSGTWTTRSSSYQPNIDPRCLRDCKHCCSTYLGLKFNACLEQHKGKQPTALSFNTYKHCHIRSWYQLYYNYVIQLIFRSKTLQCPQGRLLREVRRGVGCVFQNISESEIGMLVTLCVGGC